MNITFHMIIYIQVFHTGEICPGPGTQSIPGVRKKKILKFLYCTSFAVFEVERCMTGFCIPYLLKSFCKRKRGVNSGI